MSHAPLGELLQLGHVVPDLDAAIDGWLARGVGPFFLMRGVDLRHTVAGAEVTVGIDVALAYSGAVQIELIARRDETPSVYAAFLDAHPAGGLHHLGFLSDAYDAALEPARAKDVVVAELTNAVGGRFAYFDRDPVSGLFVEVIEASRMLTGVFAHVRAACAAWDGSAPRRALGAGT